MVIGAFSSWQPDKELLSSYLSLPNRQRLRFERLSLGVDNAHIDVALSSDLVHAVQVYVGAVLKEDIYRKLWRSPLQTPGINGSERFLKIHAAISDDVVFEARAENRLELVQLYSLALLKLLLQTVTSGFSRIRKDLEALRSEQTSLKRGGSLETHERLVLLSQHERAVIQRTTAHLMRLFSGAEHRELRRQRKMVLGISWPVGTDLLFNPLHSLGGFDDDEAFARLYPLPFRDKAFLQPLNQVVVSVLAPWLPGFVTQESSLSANPEQQGVQFRRDKGEFRIYLEIDRLAASIFSPTEFEKGRRSWLDHPVNLVRLLGGAESEWPKRLDQKEVRWEGFHKTLLVRFETALDKAGLLMPLLAAQLLPEVYPQLSLSGQMTLVHRLLVEQSGRRQILKALEGISGVEDLPEVARQIEIAVKRLRKLNRRERGKLLIAALSDFARFRYDLKSARQAYQAMDLIRLLGPGDDLELSRANGLLHEFMVDDARGRRTRPVTGHVIIKADIRGSTQITAGMLKQDLNPAVYFSRTLFDPVNALIRQYGATKVFIEGDAIILALFSHDDSGSIPVARACGLSRKLLEVIHAKNRENREFGLPALELGIGITYVDEPPTYLYDEGNRITISPAINRADRLSSCDKRLRQLAPRRGGDQGVEVVLRAGDGDAGGQGAEFVRYNVNGIELDAPAYRKLANELALRQISVSESDGLPAGEYLGARFKDSSGNGHWLIVRDAPVRLWAGGVLQGEGANGHRFYEVVTDRELFKRVRDQAAG